MLQLKTQRIYIPQAELFSYVESMLKRDHPLSSYGLSVKLSFPGLSDECRKLKCKICSAHQPSSALHSIWNVSRGSGLVRILASWGADSIFVKTIISGDNCSRNQWYLTTVIWD